MICPKCGQECSEKYCGNCGVRLYSEACAENMPFEVPEDEFGDTPPAKEGELSGTRACEGHARQWREGRGASRKRGKTKRESGIKTSSDKRIKKEMREKDGRIRRLETEVEELNHRDRKKSRRDRRMEQAEGDTGQELKEAAVKGAAGMTVLFSRILQLISFFLMAYMVWLMQGQFLRDGDTLGSIYTILEERNYALILYIGVAGCVLFFGAIWSLWILSKKDSGGSVRLKKYDTGRGLIPFFLCGAACILLPFGLSILPSPDQIAVSLESPISAGTLKELTRGGRCALSALNSHRETLLFCSLFGALLSFVRKLLRV